MFPISVNKDLVIRPLRFEDAAEFFEIVQKERKRLESTLRWPRFIQSKEDVLGYLSRCLDRNKTQTSLYLGLFLKGNFLGEIKVHQIDQTNKIALMGFWISESAEGQGILHQALIEKVIPLLFKRFHVHRVEATPTAANEKAQKLLTKLGFEYEGLLKDRERIGQKTNDSLMFSLTAPRFLRHMKKPHIALAKQKLVGTWKMLQVHGYRESKNIGSWYKNGFLVFTPNGDMFQASANDKNKYPFPIINHIFYSGQFEIRSSRTILEKYENHSIPERVGKRRNSKFKIEGDRLFWEIKSAKNTLLVFEYKKTHEPWQSNST